MGPHRLGHSGLHVLGQPIVGNIDRKAVGVVLTVWPQGRLRAPMKQARPPSTVQTLAAASEILIAPPPWPAARRSELELA